MTFHVEHAIYCPACGWFGRRARRRSRRGADLGHMRWAAQLANETRAERKRALLAQLYGAYQETDGGLFAAMVENEAPLALEQVLGLEPEVLRGTNYFIQADGVGLSTEPTPAQLDTWFR